MSKQIDDLISEVKNDPEFAKVSAEVQSHAGEIQPPIVFTRGELSAIHSGVRVVKGLFRNSASKRLDDELTGGTLTSSLESAEAKLDDALQLARVLSVAAEKEKIHAQS